MKEIQEKRIEKEISLIEQSQYFYRVAKKISKDEYYFEFKFNYPDEINKEEIIFILHMCNNYPFNPPKLYCKSAFSNPIIADGRDIVEEILGESWKTSFKLIDIVDKIPLFIETFINNLKEEIIYLAGTYTLGDKYDLYILEQLPIHLQRVKEVINIEGKEKEFNKIMLVSDMFFCLFDQERWNKNNLHLTFWTNIRALVTIKKNIDGDLCKFFWKQINKKKLYEQNLIVPENSGNLIDLLLCKMKNFGINYKISRNSNIQRTGKIPSIDIENIEKAILSVEDDLEKNQDGVHVEYLLDLYSNAVEYYSAMNDSRYEDYKKKIQSLMNNGPLTKLVNKDSNNKIQEENLGKIVLKNEDMVNKEEKIDTEEKKTNESKLTKSENQYDNPDKINDNIKTSDLNTNNQNITKNDCESIEEGANSVNEYTNNKLDKKQPSFKQTELNKEIIKVEIEEDNNNEKVKIYEDEDDEDNEDNEENN